MLAQVINACMTEGETINWSEIGIKIGTNKRPNHHKGDEVTVELPDMDFIKKDENDTKGYLVLVSKDNVIMPRYYDFLINKLNALRDNKGKSDLILSENPNKDICSPSTCQGALQTLQQEIGCNLLVRLLIVSR